MPGGPSRPDDDVTVEIAGPEPRDYLAHQRADLVGVGRLISVRSRSP